jgi:hypothetical protein
MYTPFSRRQFRQLEVFLLPFNGSTSLRATDKVARFLLM